MNTERPVPVVDLPEDPEDLGEAPAARIRALRDRRRAEERRRSDAQRIAQGHLDVADAELTPRLESG